MTERQLTAADVEAALADLKDPETGRSVVKTGQVSDVRIEADRLSLTLALTTHSAPLWSATRESAQSLLREGFPELAAIEVHSAVHDRPPQKVGEVALAAKTVIAVASGKGGVGKSTIAACLAYALNRAGSKVGLMDADVYGPSIPHLVGVDDRPEIVDGRIRPVRQDGMPIMSLGFMVPSDEAVIWRGPMLHSTITQFLRDADWGELDYLIIDLPPGTGDVALSLSQLLPLTGAVIVCTPQDVALLDAVKAIAMFRKVNIPVLGVVENMSGFVCTDCGKRHDIFGTGGARQRAEQLAVPFLGEVPINVGIRLRGDDGDIQSVLDDQTTAPPMEAICRTLVENLAAAVAESPPTPSLTVL